MSWLSEYIVYLIFLSPFQKVVTRIQIMQHLILEITVWKLHKVERQAGLAGYYTTGSLNLNPICA